MGMAQKGTNTKTKNTKTRKAKTILWIILIRQKNQVVGDTTNEPTQDC